MRIMCVGGTRPNFVKLRSIINALISIGVEPIFIHTGQHYDLAMATSFLKELGLPTPDLTLGLGDLVRSEFLRCGIRKLRDAICALRPDCVLLVGDVNSTLAGAMAAAKEGVAIAHVEAGLRSWDERMVEEFNRKMTDSLSDILFATCEDGVSNLQSEGIVSNVHLVGNPMIDTLIWATDEIRTRADAMAIQKPYGVVTLHRPELVDDPRALHAIFLELGKLGAVLPLVFPAHPRTRKCLQGIAMPCGITMIDPLSYFACLALMSKATIVVTDSGGIQEETSFLGIQCLTVRNTTERPVTVTLGTNTLVNPAEIMAEATQILNGKRKIGGIIPYWDGKASERIASILMAAKDRLK